MHEHLCKQPHESLTLLKNNTNTNEKEPDLAERIW